MATATPIYPSFISFNKSSNLNLYNKRSHLNVSVASTNQNSHNKDDHVASNNELEEILETLPHRRNWDGRMLCQYQNNWFPVGDFHGVFYCRKNFEAQNTDIILATMPKAGTTWLKALAFCIVNRNNTNNPQNPLLKSSSHDLVPFLELDTYRDQKKPYLENIHSPRIFATHVPYGILPSSIQESQCKIIYICRNPLDQFVSHRHFLLRNRLQPDEEPLSIDEAFEMYCNGIHPFGPFWDHMLDYWNGGIKNSEKVLFLKYEELKEDIVSSLKKMAGFIGMPFSLDEEKQGRIDEISMLCSLKNLKNLNVNKEGKWNGVIENSSFYRKGEVGDWKNHLTPLMAQRVEKLLDEKLNQSGLTFKNYIKSIG